MSESEILLLISTLEKVMEQLNTWSIDGHEAHLLCLDGIGILKGQLK